MAHSLLRVFVTNVLFRCCAFALHPTIGDYDRFLVAENCSSGHECDAFTDSIPRPPQSMFCKPNSSSENAGSVF
jgi:hypothetical protein